MKTEEVYTILVYTETGTPFHIDEMTARNFGLKEGDQIASEQTRRAVIETSLQNTIGPSAVGEDRTE